MKNISVLKIIKNKNAISMQSGNLVFETLKPIIESKQKVILSFESLNVCNMTFIQGSIGKLYRYFGEDLHNYLDLIKLREFWSDCVKMCIDELKIELNY